MLLKSDQIEIRSGESVLDLGCGSGPLGIVASMLSGGAPLVMVDSDVEAVRSAQKSAEAAGLRDFRALPSAVRNFALAQIAKLFAIFV